MQVRSEIPGLNPGTAFETVSLESHFEYLIGKGANFASSPGRINTHTYDPAIVAIKVASTSKNQTVDFSDISKFIEDGRKAIGGVETEGKMKLIY